MSYRVFHRTWWKRNPAWPNGLEPNLGRRTTIATGVPTEEQARAICRQWNATHPEGRYSRRAEYETERRTRRLR